MSSFAAASNPTTLKDVGLFPSSLEQPQDTYAGRFWHFVRMTDPRTLFTSPSCLAQCEALVSKALNKEPGWGDIRVAEYMDAKHRVDAIVHSESQKPILLPFRFAAFIPMNFINLCGMLHPSQQTPLRAMFWQFSNQTYNVGFNYCNGSSKDGLPMRELLVGYGVATSTACGLSYGLNKLAVSGIRGGGSASASSSSKFLQLVIPYTAVACANIANLVVIRFRDLIDGIAVKDAASGEELCDGAPSAVAGRLAVAQVALSRVLIPVPLMLFPPLFMNALFDPARGVQFLVKRRAALFMPINVATLVTVLGVALPMSIAIFPQYTVVPSTWLEPSFHHLKNSRGEEVANVTFNKGL